MRWFRNLPIRYKLLLSYSLVFTVSLSSGGFLLYTLVRNSITSNIESELSNTNETILNMVVTSAAVSIKNHLRAIAEKNREIAQYYYNNAKAGDIPEVLAKRKAAALFLNQTIGKSGYTYCMNSSGTVLVHPEKDLVGVNVAQFDFIQQQIKQKVGYLEYQWKNPSESESRPKALYMTYFEPWDWIISVTSYRREFRDVVDVDDFKASILGLRFGETGYSFVVDSQGKAIIHPKLQGVNIREDDSLMGEFLDTMWASKKGKIIYPWKNPDESRPRKKMVIFNFIPEYEWIVGSSSYLDEFFRPLHTIRTLFFVTGGFSLILILALTLKISDSITIPLKKLMDHFHRVRETNFTLRMERRSNDEIGQLNTYFNAFMEQLEHYSNDLRSEIQNRTMVEHALRESEGRYRSVMEAAPDPIVVYNMKGEVIFFNPAFTRTFGWRLEESIGAKMDHFVPEENWPETHLMIAKIASGETLSFSETCRYTKQGDIIPVSISGATYRDHNGELAGSVIILRDITNAKRLRQQIMNIADSERQKIGQDLHDDLCPHLIGIQGLCTVLKTNLSEEKSAQAASAGRIEALIENAIEKSRALARGLCPVHLVSHGLYTALDDMAVRVTTSSGIPCHFHGDESIDLDDNMVATHLFFIAQEALANAVKHAGAPMVDIALWQKAGILYLSVADTGCGFDPGMSSGGIGLQIMEYRAKMVGASITVDSRIQHGTTVQVSLKRKDGAGQKKRYE
jgi:PAS domain S-box-containing protein